MRLQRVLADAGVAARRACEALIAQGHVEVNGEVVTELPVFVDPASDRITVDGRPIPRHAAVRRVYVMLNKPARTLTVSSAGETDDRRTVLDLVDHPAASRLFPVNRLGFDETGMVLLTNDGELANYLNHPRFGVPKVYHATVKGRISDEDLARVEKEITRSQKREARLAGRTRFARVHIEVLKVTGDKTTLGIMLSEGRNKQVTPLLAAAGCSTKKVELMEFGPLTLRGLAVGEWRELEREEVRALRTSFKQAARAGKDRPEAVPPNSVASPTSTQSPSTADATPPHRGPDAHRAAPAPTPSLAPHTVLQPPRESDAPPPALGPAPGGSRMRPRSLRP